VDAGDPPVQALDSVTALLRGGRVLPHLCHRWPAGAFTSRARPPAFGPAGVIDAGVHHLQFEALLTAARESPNPYDFALVAMLGLLGLRIFEATGANIGDLGEEHGHRALRVCGKGTKIVLIPLPPAVGRAIDRAIGTRSSGPILLNSRGVQMDRHAATRRLRRLAETAGVRITRPHPHMLGHTFVTTMQVSRIALDATFRGSGEHAPPGHAPRGDRLPAHPVRWGLARRGASCEVQIWYRSNDRLRRRARALLLIIATHWGHFG
jgi:integrase/recombinase XerD